MSEAGPQRKPQATELLALPADTLADQPHEAAFGILSKLVVVRRFLADHKASAMVAGIKPFGRRSGYTAGAIEPHARPHLDKRSTLQKFSRLFKFNPHQRQPLIVPQDPHRTNRNSIASLGLPDRAPVPRGECHQAHHQHRCQHNHTKNDEDSFQR